MQREYPKFCDYSSVLYTDMPNDFNKPVKIHMSRPKTTGDRPAKHVVAMSATTGNDWRPHTASSIRMTDDQKQYTLDILPNIAK